MQINCTCCVVATIQNYNTCSCRPTSSSCSGHITGGGGFTTTSTRQSDGFIKRLRMKPIVCGASIKPATALFVTQISPNYTLAVVFVLKPDIFSTTVRFQNELNVCLLFTFQNVGGLTEGATSSP